MISLHDIRYVRIGTADMDHAVRFATRMLGLELAERDSGAAYLRSDDRDHTLVYLDAPIDQHTVGFELRTQDELDAAAVELEAAGEPPRAVPTHMPRAAPARPVPCTRHRSVH